jgi:hypothetical protein
VGLALEMIFGNDPPVERLVNYAVTAALQFWRDGAWFPRHYQAVNLFFQCCWTLQFCWGALAKASSRVQKPLQHHIHQQPGFYDIIEP